MKIFIFLFLGWFASAEPIYESLRNSGLKYRDFARCEKAEDGPCYDTSSCPLDECDVVNGKMELNSAKRQAKIDAQNAKKNEQELIKVALEKCLDLAPTTAESRECMRILILRLYPELRK